MAGTWMKIDQDNCVVTIWALLASTISLLRRDSQLQARVAHTCPNFAIAKIHMRGDGSTRISRHTAEPLLADVATLACFKRTLEGTAW